MYADKNVLQMKYARIVKLFADHLHLPYEDALSFFYRSDTYKLISQGVADMHCLFLVLHSQRLCMSFSFL